jgi:hypothetical protein
MTKNHLIWLLIIAITLSTVAVMIWASHRSTLSNDTPPLSRNRQDTHATGLRRTATIASPIPESVSFEQHRGSFFRRQAEITRQQQKPISANYL